MNLRNYTLLLAMTAFSCFGFTGCYKAYDYINHHKGDDIKQLCRIDKLIIYQDAYVDSLPVEVTAFYNTAGNPTSLRVTKPNKFVNIDQHFRYDKRNRLTDYIITYGGTAALVWHRYGYPEKNAVTDTVYGYTGFITAPAPPPGAKPDGITKYTLDGEERIIKATSLSPQGDPIGSGDYVYSKEGNLIKPDRDYAYDNRVNIYRTNKVWMFVYNDYSVNNSLPYPLEITSYNPYGLPLKYIRNATSYTFFYPFKHFGMAIDVQYSCDASSLPVKY